MKVFKQNKSYVLDFFASANAQPGSNVHCTFVLIK